MKEMIKGIVNVGYSKLHDQPYAWNSAELYEAVCKFGFDGAKGDVTPSADGKLIMCHDAEFQFDENGRVLEPGQTGVSCTPIDQLTHAECKALEYASETAKAHLGYYPHVADLEDLMKVCQKYGKIPYITVRDQQIELCVNEVFRLLHLYDLTYKCIINSFSVETLRTVREKDPNVQLSLVFGPDLPLTKELVDTAIQLGDCAVCVFWWRDTQIEGKMMEESREAMLYAKEKGVPIHLAHGSDRESYLRGLEQGFSGFQCVSPTALVD